MGPNVPVQAPVLSHEAYIETLLRPTLSESRRISDIQSRREREIDSKYKASVNEHDAATRIQKAYRGHRERRQLEGLTLVPSSRWMEAFRELRYRSATSPQAKLEPGQPSDEARMRNPSVTAKAKWRRVGFVAEHASAGERSRTSFDNVLKGSSDNQDEGGSMLMDLRYFLEMVDQKHRCGSNLQVFHEEWLRSRPDRNFFCWLDQGDGRHIDLPGCTREKLDRERIRYLSKDERRDYLVEVDGDGKLHWAMKGDLITTSVAEHKDSMMGIVRRSDNSAVSFADERGRQQAHLLDGIARVPSANPLQRHHSDGSDGSASDDSSAHPSADQPVHDQKPEKHRRRIIASPATILNKLLRASVKPGSWIYVADTIGRLYVGIKDSGAFQHASFLSGARISSAGLLGIEHGQLIYLSPLSGHYRPTTKSLRRFIGNLRSQDVDLRHLRVSHAYEVLLCIEYYGKMKKSITKISLLKNDSRDQSQSPNPGPDRKLHDAINNMSATELVEENWQRSRRSTLGKLMGDLHVKHKGSGQT